MSKESQPGSGPKRHAMPCEIVYDDQIVEKIYTAFGFKMHTINPDTLQIGIRNRTKTLAVSAGSQNERKKLFVDQDGRLAFREVSKDTRLHRTTVVEPDGNIWSTTRMFTPELSLIGPRRT